MNKIFHSYYAKLSAIFLILLVILGILQIYITTQSWSSYYRESDQKLNLHLASDMAKEILPFVHDSLDMAAIEHSIHYMMVLNPKMEIYLLDNNGKILAFFADPNKKVQINKIDLRPVKQFLAKNNRYLILGDDPRNPELRKPFSVAALEINSNIQGYLYVIIGGQQYEEAQAGIRESYLINTIIKSLLFTLGFTGIIGLILFAFLTRKLRKMSEVVQKFEEGDLNARIEITSRDEIGQLSDSFNKMADTILANIDTLKQTDKMRRELIANISHDLRSPMASFRGYLETIQMKDKSLSFEERQKYINILLETSCNLEKLVEELFELSKLDAKQVKPNPEPFSIKDLIFDVVMKFKPATDIKSIALDAVIPDGLPQAYGDIGLIDRVLSNLIENSIRYTPQNGTVSVAANRLNGHLKISVKDSGSGISEEDLPHIFDRFYRVDKSRSQYTGGSGLGLAIAKKIVEIHESTIQVVSKLNSGSTFSFELQTWPV
jgi:signal transduction histidine kinase